MTITTDNIDSFIADLGSRCEAYSRNRTRDETTGEERVIPVTENAKFREELQGATGELVAFFLTRSDEERDYLRKLVEARKSIDWFLFGAIVSATKRVESSRDPDVVRRGLAAAAILDNRADIRDLFIALGNLYLIACRVGLNAPVYFREAAEMSSPSKNLLPTYKGSTRKFLAQFEESAYFIEAVLPKLPPQ